MRAYAAIVLAGGQGKRLGGADKAAIEVGGASLLERAVSAADGAAATVVVGPSRGLSAPALTTEERPRGGGPVAAVAAGLTALDEIGAPEVVVVLACDMPMVDAASVDRLVRALDDRPDVDTVMYVDAAGRPQYLAAAYRRETLAAAIAGLDARAGASMRALVDRLTVAEIAADAELTLDCDTWQDVERVRQILEDR